MRRAVKRYTVLLEFLIALGILPGCVWSVPTAGVMPLQGYWWAGVGQAHDTEKCSGTRLPRQLLRAVLARFTCSMKHYESFFLQTATRSV